VLLLHKTQKKKLGSGMSPVFKTLQEMKSVFTLLVKVEKIHLGAYREHKKRPSDDCLAPAVGVKCLRRSNRE
jgi:hypothetical protein